MPNIMVETRPRTETRDGITNYVSRLKDVLDRLPVDDIQELIDHIDEAYAGGKQVFLVGNGGSASTASHMACDLAKTVLGPERKAGVQRIKAMALTDNVALLTAWGNDVSYETIFAEQLRTHGNPQDLLIVISASGNSTNIVEAVNAALELHMVSVGMLGFSGGVVKDMVTHAVVVPSDDYGLVEDAHMVLCHLVTEHFKRLCTA